MAFYGFSFTLDLVLVCSSCSSGTSSMRPATARLVVVVNSCRNNRSINVTLAQPHMQIACLWTWRDAINPVISQSGLYNTPPPFATTIHHPPSSTKAPWHPAQWPASHQSHGAMRWHRNSWRSAAQFLGRWTPSTYLWLKNAWYLLIWYVWTNFLWNDMSICCDVFWYSMVFIMFQIFCCISIQYSATQ